MLPKQIKACGKAKPEIRVETKERDSIATRMAVDGISNTPEYIAFVDNQVASWKWSDAVAEEIRSRISAVTGGKHNCGELIVSIVDSAKKLTENPWFIFQCSTVSVQPLTDRQKNTPLIQREEKEVDSIVKQVLQDSSDIERLDRALAIIRNSVIVQLGIDVVKTDGLSNVKPMDISSDGPEEDNSSDEFHIDLDAFGKKLETDSK